MDAARESKEKEERIKLCKIKFPIQIYTYLATIVDVELDEDCSMNEEEGSWT
jgi:hypothetical protein